MSDDLSPGVWPIVRSRGDGFTPTAFSVEVDDIPVVVTGALAHRDIMVADIVDPPPSPDSPDVPAWKAPTGAHDAYRPGAVIRYAGGVYRNISDTFLTHSPADYPRGWERQDKPADPPKTPVWGPNVAYKAGDQVTYQGSVYKCVTGHTSLVGWEPDAVPALWAKA